MSGPSSAALGRPRRLHGKRSLATLLREHGVLSVAHAADLALDICDQLASAHERGVVHGQLGLRCVRLSLSREDGPQDVEIFTLTADTDGPIEEEALPFLAPEHRDLTRPIDGRADIFALAAVLYNVLVGQPPPADMLTGVEPAVLPLDEMPSSLASILEDCLAVDPEARPRDVDELTEKIASFATWPPDRFTRLAARREARLTAERVRRALEARGLSNMPEVLDRLDDAAMARASRESATVEKAAPSSLLPGELPGTSTTSAALDRLMAVVHEGTEAARQDHAENLPALVDFDDEDDEGQATVVKDPIEETFPLPLECAPVVQSGVTVPLAMPEPPAPIAAPSNVPSVFLSPSLLPASGARRSPLLLAAVAVAACLGASAIIFFLTRSTEPSITMTTSAAPSVTAAPLASPAAPPPTSTIPVFSPQSLPEVAPVTPGSLPNAKH